MFLATRTERTWYLFAILDWIGKDAGFAVNVFTLSIISMESIGVRLILLTLRNCLSVHRPVQIPQMFCLNKRETSIKSPNSPSPDDDELVLTNGWSFLSGVALARPSSRLRFGSMSASSFRSACFNLIFIKAFLVNERAMNDSSMKGELMVCRNLRRRRSGNP